MALQIWIGLFFLMFIFGYPVAFAISVSSMLYIILEGIDPAVIVDRMAIHFQTQFVLLAVPLFIFAGKVMNEGDITPKIFGFANSLVGPLKGGLGHVNVVASLIFSGMTGSAIADTSGVGYMATTAMEDAGFDAPFSCSVTAASSTVGPIIPPSIPMVIYASISGASTGYLFIGGIIPGFILALFLMVYIWFISKKRDYPAGESYNLKKLVVGFGRSFLPLLTPVILLGGIYSGVFTPTEAAAAAGFYALILTTVIYRKIGLKKLWAILKDTALSTGYVAFIVAAAFLFSYIVAREGIARSIAAYLSALGIMANPIILLFTLNILFLILGMFLDTMVVLVIVIPIFLSVLTHVGIDLVHFGVVAVFNLMIGLSTPPYGVNLFIISGLTETPLGKIFKEIIPFLAALIFALLLISFFPEIVLFLPKVLGYTP